MRIGIITVPQEINNYGNILQKYAMQTVLEKMGHGVEIVESGEPARLPLRRLLLRCGYKAAMKLKGQPYVIFHERQANRRKRQDWKNDKMFVGKYLNMALYDNVSDIRPDSYDAFVVGSDQVWRKAFAWKKDVEHNFLDFASGWDVRRVAYAASFGVDCLEGYTREEAENCRRLARLFDAVSVREQSGVKLCKRMFGIDARLVLDPTLLLEKADYEQLINAANTPKSPGSLFSYVLDESPQKRAIVEMMAEERHLTPFQVDFLRSYDDFREEKNGCFVEKWLAAFRDAEFVVTDSFHGCVFSILFKKQFVVIPSRYRGLTRFETLLGSFGLGSRQVDTMEDAQRIGGEIDYGEVYNKLREYKSLSLDFIKGQLR